jgi:LDH2 family malate/lactate/ureidoglycolate dehydrogenase
MVAGPTPGQDGHFFLAIRVGAFEEVDRFKSRVDRAIREVHASRRASGVDHIFLAGERERQTRLRSAEQGIPLNSSLLGDLRRVVRDVGLDDGDVDRLAIDSA